MTKKQRNEIKETLVTLDLMISQSDTAEVLVKTQGFSELFAKVCKCLEILEKEWILNIPGSFDSRDAINNFVGRMEIVKLGVENGFAAESGDVLQESLREAKIILADIKKHLNS